jgi:NAD(P) transhydrogenase
VGTPREIYPNERRVSLTPQNCATLYKKGFSKVLVEYDAGSHAQFLNEQYTAAGATLVTREELFRTADIMLKVRPPALGGEADHVKQGSTVISLLYPTQNKDIVEVLAKRKVNAFAMDMIPRISRAQAYDALRCESFTSRGLHTFSSSLAPWPTFLVIKPSWRPVIISVDF